MVPVAAQNHTMMPGLRPRRLVRGTTLAETLSMAVSIFSVVGVVAVLAVGVAGIGASLLVKDRIRIEFHDDAPKDDGLAIVRDDLRSMQTDLQALTKALGQQLGEFGTAMGQQEERSTSESKAVLLAIASLERALGAQSGRLQGLERQLASLESRAPSEHMESSPVPSAVAAVTLPAVESEPSPAAPVPESRSDPVVPSTQKPKAFLGFQLPSRAFHFDQVQQFEILPELSRVGFDAKSTLHDFSGVTSKITGSFAANLADQAGAWTGWIACEATTLATGVEGRDTAMREHLDTEHHAEVRYTIESFTPDVGGIDAAKETVSGSVNGTFEIRGQKKAVSLRVKLSVDSSRRVSVEGQTTLHLPDFAVPVPSQLGLISMEPDVLVWVALRARVSTRAARAR